MKKRVIRKIEWMWYSIAIFFATGGVTLAILSIIGQYLNVSSADNWIIKAEEAVKTFLKIKFDWLIWGTILIGLGLVVALISLLYFAKKDLEAQEKAQRRAQRLGSWEQQ